MTVDIVQYNDAWLKAWTDKDVEALGRFYAADCAYRDAAVPGGLTGRDALRAYLTAMFAKTPAMVYAAEETWPIPGGFCARWYCALGENGALGRLRGFDMVLLRGDEIVFNEVYTHTLPA